ncbi:MAG: hydroxymethylglutaryl-CoA lyase [Taibaiella sp.]|nr:hydroxymethylglutaryl-CoA lyase [Taibaiella sp.]
MKQISIVECPRDAMQGWPHLIPTATKIAYLNQLLDVGFDVLDFGSFVSSKAIPQMADTREVLASLKPSSTELLAIIANTRGAAEACRYERISYLGFPFSISETFQMRNTNKSIADSFDQVREIQELAQKHGKRMVIYISMGFGNPYGDPYSAQLAIDYVGKITGLGIQIVAMSDTIGIADPENIDYIFSQLIPAFPDTEIGAHFHSTPHTRIEKLAAAYRAGCTRFDSSINGIGGCPMAKDELVGNMATETLVSYFEQQGALPSLNRAALDQALALAPGVFR